MPPESNIQYDKISPLQSTLFNIQNIHISARSIRRIKIQDDIDYLTSGLFLSVRTCFVSLAVDGYKNLDFQMKIKVVLQLRSYNHSLQQTKQGDRGSTT